MQVQDTTTIDFTSYNSIKGDEEISCPSCGLFTDIDIFNMAYQTEDNNQIGCPLCRPDQYPRSLII